MRRMLCRMFGHRLYAEPVEWEFCHCRCGRSFRWIEGDWRELPDALLYRIA